MQSTTQWVWVWLLLLLTSRVHGKVFFQEEFDETWTTRWKNSTWKQEDGSAGYWQLATGDWYGDAEADKGIQTTPDSKFYTTWAEFPEFSNAGKDLVLQYSVKHTQDLNCGGGYLKLLPGSSGDRMADFSGETPYSIMFGPDKCGYDVKKVHVILTYKGKNHLINTDIPCETDQLTHVYTLALHPNNTYEVLIDNEVKAKGSLYEHWEMLPPKTIKDPDAVKPEDWDEREEIHDPEDVKPDDWEDTPERIPDSEAAKPDDWDDAEDGEWEPPSIKNPEFKGVWKQKMIPNPAYKGSWEAPTIENPEYAHDDELYKFDSLKYVGFELWQVQAGTIFDNILITDDKAYAAEFAEKTWGASKEKEKAMFDELEKKRKDKEEAEREKKEAEEAANKKDDDEINTDPVDVTGLDEDEDDRDEL